MGDALSEEIKRIALDALKPYLDKKIDWNEYMKVRQLNEFVCWIESTNLDKEDIKRLQDAIIAKTEKQYYKEGGK